MLKFANGLKQDFVIQNSVLKKSRFLIDLPVRTSNLIHRAEYAGKSSTFNITSKPATPELTYNSLSITLSAQPLQSFPQKLVPTEEGAGKQSKLSTLPVMPDLIRHPEKNSQLSANGCYWIPFFKGMTMGEKV
jgi:hypothetical protein